MRCDHCERCVGKIANTSIVVDANLIINLVNAIAENLPRNMSNAQKNERFLAILGMYLYKFCKCPASDSLITSEQILNNELDPRKHDSAIIRNSPFLKDYYGYHNVLSTASSAFMTNIWNTLNCALKAIPVSREELAAIVPYLAPAYLDPENGLTTEDRSLIICSLKQSILESTVVVTSDFKLESAIKSIISLGKVNFPLGELSTKKMLPKDVQSYVSCLHSCCEMTNVENKTVYLHLLSGDINRIDELSPKVLQVKKARLVQMAKEHEKIVQDKNEREFANMRNIQ